MADKHIALVLSGGRDFGNSLKSSKPGRSGRGHLFSLLVNILVGFAVFLAIVVFTDSPSDGSNAASSYRRPRGLVDRSTHSNLADQLEREMRIACLILTSPKSHKTKAAAVKSTWGRHCTKLLFITTQQDDDLGTLVIDIEEKYEHLWGKTRNAFEYMYENHLEDFDWFLKADDDTYVIMENLRYLLHPYSPEMPIWFGFNFKLGPGKEKVHAYMSGGSGYVLSREALWRFGNVSLNTPSGCKVDDDTGSEDGEMGICLKTANVVAGDSRDSSQKIRFGIFNPDGALMGKLWPTDFWYIRKSFFQIYNSREALSNYAVSFHYITPAEMHMYEYLLYEFEAVGLEQPLETLPKKLSNEKVIRPVGDNDWE